MRSCGGSSDDGVRVFGNHLDGGASLTPSDEFTVFIQIDLYTRSSGPTLSREYLSLWLTRLSVLLSDVLIG